MGKEQEMIACFPRAMSGSRLSKEQYALQVAMHPKFMVHASTDTEPGKDGELLAETLRARKGGPQESSKFSLVRSALFGCLPGWERAEIPDLGAFGLQS
mmetsp:Transcript_4624/g.10911  ORF Transcript_4624/g.10911 Transcript_4624/m.10911 type:complete len:99 (-) Transcript_4624:108-404(-)